MVGAELPNIVEVAAINMMRDARTETHGVRAGQEAAKKGIGFIEKFLQGKDGELSVIGRLASGACAGMTSSFVTYPLDVLTLRLAVDPGYKTMSEKF
ncbi:hypothetical protein P3S68_013874 [Capsicum galapagoense]